MASRLISVENKEMNLQHLIYIKSVDTTCHENIAKNKFFDLVDLFKADPLHYLPQWTVTHREKTSDGQVVSYMRPIQGKLSDPKKHQELYQLLYTFGQYYPKFAVLPREGCGVPGALDLLNQVLQPPVSPNFGQFGSQFGSQHMWNTQT